MTFNHGAKLYSFLLLGNRPKLALLHARAALDALAGVDDKGLFDLAADGPDRAVAGAESTSDTEFRINVVHQ